MLAQTTTGTFGGTVSDATGGRVAQAAVTALNVETGQKFKAVTTDTGDFIIVQLPTGQYEVDVVAKGFKTLSRKGLTLDVAGKVTLDLTLEIGSISESVSVTAEAPMLRTQDAQVGDIINSLMVENLPQLDRNALDLMKLSGNVAGNGVPGGFQSDIRLNGGRQQGLDVLVDGNSVILGKGHNVGSGGTPTMEQVDEFKVITNGIPAEYGRVSGGLLTLVTKGGTNEFHGQLFEYFQNQMLNANSWEFNNELTYTPGHKAPVAAFHNNEYGFRVGGPVEVPKIYKGKNKTFFFVNWEQIKNRQAGNPKLSMAATTADKNGNMSDIIANGAGPMMYDPLGDATYDPTANAGNGAWVHTVLMPNNGTTVPAARIGPVAQKVRRPDARAEPHSATRMDAAVCLHRLSGRHDQRLSVGDPPRPHDHRQPAHHSALQPQQQLQRQLGVVRRPRSADWQHRQPCPERLGGLYLDSDADHGVRHTRFGDPQPRLERSGLGGGRQGRREVGHRPGNGGAHQ